MPVTRTDGTVVYRYPDPVADVKLNGVSVINLEVLEVWLNPQNGEGLILSRKKLGESSKPKKRWVDGQWRNYITRGKIEVTLS